MDRDVSDRSRDEVTGFEPSIGIAISFAIIAGGIVGSLVTWVTWDMGISWLGIKGFGDISKHTPYLFDGFSAAFLSNDAGHRWANYLAQIRSNDALGSLMVHLGFPFILSAIVAWKAGEFGYKVSVPRPIHKRGLRYIRSVGKAKFAIKEVARNELNALKECGYEIFPSVTITKERENRGMMVLGGIGSGKSQFMWPIIKQLVAGNHRILITDQKGEFTASLPVSDDAFCLIAPWDARSIAWDIATDVTTKADARLVAGFLIKDSHDPMWAEAGRQVLVGAICYLIDTTAKRWGFDDLKSVMTTEPEVFAKIVQKYAPEAVQSIKSLEDESGKTGQSILIQLQSYMSPFYDLADAWKGGGGFSIRRWLDDDYSGPKIVLLQGSERFKTLSNAIVSALLELGVSKIADPAFPEAMLRDVDYRIYFYLEEFPTLGKIQAIERLISVCRSKGARVILTAQDINQLRATYGDEIARTWFSQIQTKYIGTLAMGESATWLSEHVFGRREVEYPRKSFSVDKISGQVSESISYETRDELVIYPSELSQDLSANRLFFRGIIVANGWPCVYRLQWKTTKLEKVRDAYIEAPWVSGMPVAQIALERKEEDIFDGDDAKPKRGKRPKKNPKNKLSENNQQTPAGELDDIASLERELAIWESKHPPMDATPEPSVDDLEVKKPKRRIKAASPKSETLSVEQRDEIIQQMLGALRVDEIEMDWEFSDTIARFREGSCSRKELFDAAAILRNTP